MLCDHLGFGRSTRSGLGRCAFPKAILEPPVDTPEMLDASSSGRLSALSLCTPVILPDGLSRISTAGAGGLLDVVGAPPTPPAEGVGLVLALSKTGRTLRHLGKTAD